MTAITRRSARWIGGIAVCGAATTVALGACGFEEAPADDSDASTDASSTDRTADDRPSNDGGNASDAVAPDALDAKPAPLSCADAGVLMCDDFEQGILPVWTTIAASTASATSDSARVHRGSRSLHLHVNAIPTAAYPWISLHRGTTSLPSDFFLRVFIYVPNPAPLSDMTLVVLESQPQNYAITFGETAGAPSHPYASDFAHPTQQSATTAPRDQWVCREWGIHTTGVPDAGTREMRVWENEQELPALHFTNLKADPLYSVWLQVLFAAPNPQAAVDVYMDDLILDVAPIGCSK